MSEVGFGYLGYSPHFLSFQKSLTPGNDHSPGKGLQYVARRDFKGRSRASESDI